MANDRFCIIHLHGGDLIPTLRSSPHVGFDEWFGKISKGASHAGQGGWGFEYKDLKQVVLLAISAYNLYGVEVFENGVKISHSRLSELIGVNLTSHNFEGIFVNDVMVVKPEVTTCKPEETIKKQSGNQQLGLFEF